MPGFSRFFYRIAEFHIVGYFETLFEANQKLIMPVCATKL